MTETGYKPLADEIRPRNLDEVVGQQHILGKDGLLRRIVESGSTPNMIFYGPSGTGKTFIASGLVHDAVMQGYKAYMVTMEDIVNTIRMKPVLPSAMTAYNRLLRADLIAIDDIMLFPVKKDEATGFFNLINTLHEKTSLIITTNKAPTEWAKTLDDEVLATAILDRLLYRCEVIKLSGKSYRMGNRKTIFASENENFDDAGACPSIIKETNDNQL